MKKALIAIFAVSLIFFSCKKNGQAVKDETKVQNADPNIDELVYDMTGVHEKEPNGVPHDWGKAPRMGYGGTAVNFKGEKFRAFIPWGQVYVAKGTEPVANTRVQLKNIKAFYLSKSTNTWKPLQFTELVSGAHYVEDFSGDKNIPASPRRETEGLSIKTITGYNYHFWSESGRTTIDPDDLKAIAVTIQARLIVDDASKPDDRDKSTYILSMGADYWLDLATQWKPDWTANGDVAIGKFKVVTKDWKSFSMHTLTAEEIRKNPPPFVK